MTKQPDDDGSAGKLASLRNERRGDPAKLKAKSIALGKEWGSRSRERSTLTCVPKEKEKDAWMQMKWDVCLRY